MRIAFMSDLHREFVDGRTRLASDEPRVPFYCGPKLSKIHQLCDVLVIAGDLGLGNIYSYLRDAAEFLGVRVLYVPGNHEFYGSNVDRVMGDIRASVTPGLVRVLDRDETVIRMPDGGGRVRFLGCMLWTDFGLFGDDNRARCKQLAGSMISDYSQISIGPVDADGKLYRRLTPSDTHGFFIRDRSWLEGKLEEPFQGKTVVITHMAPSMRSVPERYRHDPLSAAFASNLDDLIERTQPDLWIHGHTHDSFDYRIGRTRVVCNPYGYYGRELNPEFREDLVVEI